MRGPELIAGVDEAGRGPLAGRVYAAAVILPADFDLPAMLDSKQLRAIDRERLFHRIRACAVAYAVAWAEVEEIDRLNILQATLLAMQRAVLGLQARPARVVVDGNRCPDLPVPATALVNGDASDPAIGAASILAKVTRDRYMCELAREFPEYGFDAHKGYGTRRHLNVLQSMGVTPHHRRSFAPVARLLKP